MNSTTYGWDEYGNEAEDIRSGYIGEIKMFGFSGVPAHCLACDGSLLSITAYPELYAKLGTQHGGDGVTTFALPTAEDVIYAAGNGRAVGAAVADGLPNIIGQLGWYTEGLFSLTSGVFSGVPARDPDRVLNGTDSASVANYSSATFSAASYNPIYGASAHVQPKGTAFNFCIVYE